MTARVFSYLIESESLIGFLGSCNYIFFPWRSKYTNILIWIWIYLSPKSRSLVYLGKIRMWESWKSNAQKPQVIGCTKPSKNENFGLESQGKWNHYFWFCKVLRVLLLIFHIILKFFIISIKIWSILNF